MSFLLWKRQWSNLVPTPVYLFSCKRMQNENSLHWLALMGHRQPHSNHMWSSLWSLSNNTLCTIDRNLSVSLWGTYTFIIKEKKSSDMAGLSGHSMLQVYLLTVLQDASGPCSRSARLVLIHMMAYYWKENQREKPPARDRWERSQPCNEQHPLWLLDFKG